MDWQNWFVQVLIHKLLTYFSISNTGTQNVEHHSGLSNKFHRFRIKCSSTAVKIDSTSISRLGASNVWLDQYKL